MTVNAEGDLAAFVAALVTNGVACVGCAVIVSVLRVWYPLMFSNNCLLGTAPAVPDGFFGWMQASVALRLEDVVEAAGLDQAMLLEFSHLAMKVLAIVGLPMMLIAGPSNLLFGGHAAGSDRLSYLSLGNVRTGSPLYWAHAVAVWGVVIAVQGSIWKAQHVFLKYRYRWLRSLPPARANTVLVEGIPAGHRSDAKLADFMSRVVGGHRGGAAGPGVLEPQGPVQSACVVKDTGTLLPLVRDFEAARAELRDARARWECGGRRADARPLRRASTLQLSPTVDSIEYWRARVLELLPAVHAEQERLQLAALAEEPGVNLSRGFVTFHSRTDAEIALRLDGVSRDADEWRISDSPDAGDIRWADLTQDPAAERSREVVGHLLVAGVYFAYMPLVFGVTSLAKTIHMGPLQPLWQGLAPTVGLQFMVAFLPSFLVLIIYRCFTVHCEQGVQWRIQRWYFWFQLVFVVLAAAVGQDVPAFTRALLTDPVEVFNVLANTMPYATHFYMGFIVLQWTTHALNITRYSELGKFLVLRRVFGEADAREMAEPEDQDYYGMGSRSARWSIMLVIGIVYGTLCPPINFLVFVNFAICRLVYGYLLVFAEDKKSDLGGKFWMGQMDAAFIGNTLYCVLMMGVLYHRASGLGPFFLASPSLLYVLWSRARFTSAFNCWERLPLEELLLPSADDGPAISQAVNAAEPCKHGPYTQPELREPAPLPPDEPPAHGFE